MVKSQAHNHLIQNMPVLWFITLESPRVTQWEYHTSCGALHEFQDWRDLDNFNVENIHSRRHIPSEPPQKMIIGIEFFPEKFWLSEMRTWLESPNTQQPTWNPCKNIQRLLAPFFLILVKLLFVFGKRAPLKMTQHTPPPPEQSMHAKISTCTVTWLEMYNCDVNDYICSSGTIFHCNCNGCDLQTALPGEAKQKKILDQVLTQPWTRFWLKKTPNLGPGFDSTAYIYIYICAVGRESGPLEVVIWSPKRFPLQNRAF